MALKMEVLGQVGELGLSLKWAADLVHMALPMERDEGASVV